MPTPNNNEALRVLLVSEDESIRHGVQEALDQASRTASLSWVSQPELAVTRAKDLMPQLAIVDDALGGADPATLIKQLLNVAPGAVVLMLVEEAAMAQASAAVMAGARGFLIKPWAPGALAANIREVLGRQSIDGRSEQRSGESFGELGMGRIVAFCAPKGGTGRTTLAINTAIFLHQSTQRSLVMLDADFAAPSLDVALNLHETRTVADLLPRLSQLDRELADSILIAHASGMRVLTAPPPGTLEAPITLPQVQQMLAGFKRMYGWTVVDLGLPLDEMAFAYLDAADRIVMTVLPEMTGLRNTRLMLEQLSRRGYAADKVGLVVNRATMQGGISRRDIEERLHVKVMHTVPDDQPLVSYSINRGVPVMLSKPQSAVGRSIAALGKHITTTLMPAAAQRNVGKSSTSLRSRWLRLGRAVKA